MPRDGLKCEATGCHRRFKLDETERNKLRAFGEKHDARAGVICPPCFEAALDMPDKFEADLSEGEILVQLVSNAPPWRILLVPHGQPKELRL